MPHVEFKLHGETIPSVTTFLSVIGKPMLYRWYAKHGWEECERVKKESAAFGSKVHDGIETRLKGEVFDERNADERTLELVGRAVRWVNESEFTPIALETHVVHEELRYHGTFDALGEFKSQPGVLWIMDWKTSNYVDVTYGLQLAAYAGAWNAQNGKTWETGVNHGGILRLSKDPKARKQVEAVTFNNLRRHFAAVEATRELYEYLNQKG